MRGPTSPGLRPKGWAGHEVYPGVFVGDVSCALDLAQLQARSISHIITATNRMKPLHDSLHYLVLDFPDAADQMLLDAFDEAHQFMDQARNAGGKVLVHCMMGQSRSVSVVVSYIMRCERCSHTEALARVREVRPDAKPIEAFQQQLALYHEMDCKVDTDHPEVDRMRRSLKKIPVLKAPAKK